MDLDLLSVSGLSSLHDWYCQVNESVSHLVQLAFFQVLYQFNCLKGSHATGCGWQGWGDSACFQFCRHPVHRVQLVVCSSKVCHRVNQVDMPVLVIVLLEFLSIYFDIWFCGFQHIFYVWKYFVFIKSYFDLLLLFLLSFWTFGLFHFVCLFLVSFIFINFLSHLFC